MVHGRGRHALADEVGYGKTANWLGPVRRTIIGRVWWKYKDGNAMAEVYWRHVGMVCIWLVDMFLYLSIAFSTNKTALTAVRLLSADVMDVSS